MPSCGKNLAGILEAIRKNSLLKPMKPKGALPKSIRHNTGSSAKGLVPFFTSYEAMDTGFNNKKATCLIKVKIR